MSVKPLVVGITGGSASGKTTFLKNLLSAFSSDQVCLISQDNYYLPKELQPVDDMGIENFDLPESVDLRKYATDLKDLKEGRQVELEEYTFNNPNIVPKKLVFKSAPIIIVEGLFVFYDQDLSDLIDVRVFIDAQEHIKLKRRIVRDSEERNEGLEEVLYRYEKHVQPTYDKFIRPFKSTAHIIIPNNTTFDIGLGVLVSHLKQHVNS
ncbi:uridine kinase [Persicobacter psychrovividus]|uniref:Uridine kinase n=1 Tax=Persicobacter psychrovividus TaxID=387638 RepID=A0ABN6LFA9_9BACT|nr:uridine kinase [Persicobacter psychrovividus]